MPYAADRLCSQKRSPVKDPTFKHREGETTGSEDDGLDGTNRGKRAKKNEAATVATADDVQSELQETFIYAHALMPLSHQPLRLERRLHVGKQATLRIVRLTRPTRARKSTLPTMAIVHGDVEAKAKGGQARVDLRRSRSDDETLRCGTEPMGRNGDLARPQVVARSVSKLERQVAHRPLRPPGIRRPSRMTTRACLTRKM